MYQRKGGFVFPGITGEKRKSKGLVYIYSVVLDNAVCPYFPGQLSIAHAELNAHKAPLYQWQSRKVVVLPSGVSQVGLWNISYVKKGTFIILSEVWVIYYTECPSCRCPRDTDHRVLPRHSSVSALCFRFSFQRGKGKKKG